MNSWKAVAMLTAGIAIGSLLNAACGGSARAAGSGRAVLYMAGNIGGEEKFCPEGFDAVGFRGDTTFGSTKVCLER